MLQCRYPLRPYCGQDGAIYAWCGCDRGRIGRESFVDSYRLITTHFHDFWAYSPQLPKIKRENRLKLSHRPRQRFAHSSLYPTGKSLRTLADVYFSDFIQNNIAVRQCAHCDRYFVPINHAEFCDRSEIWGKAHAAVPKATLQTTKPKARWFLHSG